MATNKLWSVRFTISPWYFFGCLLLSFGKSITFMPARKSSTPIKPPIPSSVIKPSTICSMLLIFVAVSAYLLSIAWVVPSEWEMLFVILSTMEEICSMLETSCVFEVSTSFMAESITWMWSPSSLESVVIFSTLLFVSVTFSNDCWISSSVCSTAEVIFAEVSDKRVSASRICPEEVCVSVLSTRIWSATTANPRPESPARAASIEAFSAKRFVWLEISSIVPVSVITRSNSDLNSFNTFSTSADNDAIVEVVSTTPSKSLLLVAACSPDSLVSSTICSIKEETLITCVLISVVISSDEFVLSCKVWLFAVSSFMPSTTTSAPCLFSTASSRTTVTPSTMELLASFTCSTVVTTRCKSSFT